MQNTQEQVSAACDGRGLSEMTRQTVAAAAAHQKASKSISVSQASLNGSRDRAHRHSAAVELSGDNMVQCRHLVT